MAINGPVPNQNTFPWWYTWLKWMLPITLAIAASAWLGLTLTAAIPAYGMLKWAPVFFSSLEGFSSFAVLTLAMGAIASMTGLASSVLVRAALFNVTENMAAHNLQNLQHLQTQYTELKKETDEKLKKAREDADKELKALGDDRDKIRYEYNQYLITSKIPGNVTTPAPTPVAPAPVEQAPVAPAPVAGVPAPTVAVPVPTVAVPAAPVAANEEPAPAAARLKA